MYRLFLNNGESFEIDNLIETYDWRFSVYNLNFNILNSNLNIITIINTFSSIGALSSIYVKDENNKIIFSSNEYKSICNVNKIFGRKVTEADSIQVVLSTEEVPVIEDPMSRELNNINNTLKELFVNKEV